jgi:hypothetical protein
MILDFLNLISGQHQNPRTERLQLCQICRVKQREQSDLKIRIKLHQWHRQAESKIIIDFFVNSREKIRIR